MPIFLAKYLWLIGIAWALLNYRIRKSEEKELVARRPELEENLKKLAVGFFIFYAAPWVVMGVGILSGGAQSAFDYLRPCHGSNPFVIAFHATVLLLVLGVALWIWFRDGANFLLRHSEDVRGSVLGVKLKFAAGVLLILIWFGFACGLGLGSSRRAITTACSGRAGSMSLMNIEWARR